MPEKTDFNSQETLPSKKQAPTNNDTSYLAIGVGLGVALGAALSAALHNPAFIGVGIALGAGIGTALNQNED